MTTKPMETDNLLLRIPSVSDAKAIFQNYATDPEVTRYLPWKPHKNIGETRRYLKGLLEKWITSKEFTWVIIDKKSRDVMGMIALRVQGYKAEFGYVLARRHWNRGYMTEALKKIIELCFDTGSIYRVWGVCDIENPASKRVMEKSGLSYEGILKKFIRHPNISDVPRDVQCYAITLAGKREDEKRPPVRTGTFMLETDRLMIRRFGSDDWADLFEYLSLPETYAFEPGEPVSIDAAKRMAAERAAGTDFYAVDLKDEKKMIGHIYLGLTGPKEYETMELGYIFNPRFRSRGFCTEAAAAVVNYAFRELKPHKIVAHCNPLNEASWKVLEKIGMQREGCFRQKAFFRKDKKGNPLWHDCYAYGILKG
ncbi:MAG: GNAT family N-acetyltransferase [Spirochaetales bacterium]|nr:GNAT family N-acetyltransferase [Spirochaetales bacterium]